MKYNKYKYLLAFILFFFVSCAGLQQYYSRLESFMVKDDAESAGALAMVSKQAYGEKNELLYFLDVGMLNHLSGKYQQSNEAFEQAKKIYDLNYTKSISSGLFSLFTNDNTVPYYGKSYEMAYANVFCALNYIMMGMNNEAVVEARQIDNLFKKIKADSGGKAYYKDDGFIRYIMGLVYENAGYFNDALISYKLAVKAYDGGIYNVSAPQDLINRLYALYYNLGMMQEAAFLRSKYPSANRVSVKSSCGELIVVNYNGLSPKKIDNIIDISFFKAWPYFNAVQVADQERAKAEQVRSAVQAGLSDGYIKVAFPQYQRYGNSVSSFSIEDLQNTGKTDDETSQIKSFKAADIAALLEKTLDKEIALIYARTIARAVGRYVLTKTISDGVEKKSENQTLGIFTKSLLNVASSILETADKRSWRTLPDNINMSAIVLSSGTHKININFSNNSSNAVISKQFAVEIRENKKTFLLVNSFVNCNNACKCNGTRSTGFKSQNYGIISDNGNNSRDIRRRQKTN